MTELGEDGKLAEWLRNDGRARNRHLGPNAPKHRCEQAGDRLILYREAREKLANVLLAGTLSMSERMVHIDFETREDAEAMFEALGDVLSRSA